MKPKKYILIIVIVLITTLSIFSPLTKAYTWTDYTTQYNNLFSDEPGYIAPEDIPEPVIPAPTQAEQPTIYDNYYNLDTGTALDEIATTQLHKTSNSIRLQILFNDLNDYANSNVEYYNPNATGGTPSTITDLTGYSWVGNETLSLTAFGFNIDFISNNTNYDFLVCSPNQYTGNNILTYVYNPNNIYRIVYGVSWGNEAYKTIQITGGTDATNQTLITWLQNNGTLTAPVDLSIWEIGVFNDITNLGFFDSTFANVNFLKESEISLDIETDNVYYSYYLDFPLVNTDIETNDNYNIIDYIYTYIQPKTINTLLKITLFSATYYINPLLLLNFAYDYSSTYTAGFNSGYNMGYYDIYGDVYHLGWQQGTQDTPVISTQWFTALFSGIQGFLDIQIGAMSIGSIVLIPFAITVVWFIIRQFRGGGGSSD